MLPTAAVRGWMSRPTLRHRSWSRIVSRHPSFIELIIPERLEDSHLLITTDALALLQYWKIGLEGVLGECGEVDGWGCWKPRLFHVGGQPLNRVSRLDFLDLGGKVEC